MSAIIPSKLNSLLASHPSGAIVLTSWLKKLGYSYSLQAKYRSSKWFESIGQGALIRKGDKVNYLGGVYALQTQSQSSIHPAALTALELSGNSHYLRFSSTAKTLMGGPKEQLPTWYKNYNWKVELTYMSTSFIKPNLGLTQIMHEGMPILISTRPRAILECLYMAPQQISLLECFQLLENLNNLQPAHVQELLINCSSIRVKRLFLYMAAKANHQWSSRLDLSKIDLGTGKRSIVKGGVFIPEFNITVPKELDAYD